MQSISFALPAGSASLPDSLQPAALRLALRRFGMRLDTHGAILVSARFPDASGRRGLGFTVITHASKVGAR